ncbi:hypothetical protein GCM10027614_22760 [Micromonospora vulcania]
MTTLDRTTPTVPAPAAGRDAQLRPDRGVANAFSHGFLLIWGLLTVLPLVWMFISSFKTNGEILADPWGLPGALHLDNWTRAWTGAHLGRYFLNSLVVVAGSVSLTMLMGSTAAYVFARYEFRASSSSTTCSSAG